MAKKNDDIWFLVLGLAAIGGVMIADDQHTKRQQEQARFREALAYLQAILAQREAELATLQAQLGPKNDQVRRMAAEVERLREELRARIAA